ncbi:hypothetical protein CO2235_MP80299 [Cupriavidus oxalaticus]|uniref:Uncharacterized protein n=1 Tax=Cupriavidus oxalaticus TaxID=96344 RepID=A0A375GMB3_9BURK|nr:hypothetical protein CO2235_U770191 [Cupriavidus oxalaticus]SPC24419.1 hypothetical protein CO2235_MP80299 [Cupriavidus oxalaticus]
MGRSRAAVTPVEYRLRRMADDNAMGNPGLHRFGSSGFRFARGGTGLSFHPIGSHRRPLRRMGPDCTFASAHAIATSECLNGADGGPSCGALRSHVSDTTGNFVESKPMSRHRLKLERSHGPAGWPERLVHPLNAEASMPCHRHFLLVRKPCHPGRPCEALHGPAIIS